jgi:hypothetical protein
MGTMTLLQMRTEVAASTQRSVAFLTATRLNQWINWTLFDFGYAFKFRELEGLDPAMATVVGQTAYTMPADWRMWHELGMRLYNATTNFGKLLPEAREQYLMKVNSVDVSSRGQPLHYHQFAAQFFLRPLPDAIYSVERHYWKKIVPLAADADLSPFKDEWDEIIVIGATARALRSLGEYDRYVDIKNDYLGQIRSRVLEEDIEQFPEGSIMPYPQSEGELETGVGS